MGKKRDGFEEGDGFVMDMGLGREMGWGGRCAWGGRWVGGWRLETADALWEGHTLLRTGVLTDTQRHTKVKTVYPPVSLCSLGGYYY